MNFVLHLASYLVALFVVMILDWLGVLLGFALPFLPRRKVTAIPFRFLLDAGSSLFSVILVKWIGDHTVLSVSRAMVLFPAVLVVLNDVNRRLQVMRGESTVQVLLDTTGESTNYDKGWDIRMKKAEMWGHLVGYSTGVFEVLSGEPFF